MNLREALDLSIKENHKYVCLHKKIIESIEISK